jgi:hypothetical protein
MMKYYHGGAPALQRGAIILPGHDIGAPGHFDQCNVDRMSDALRQEIATGKAQYRPDRVYVTTDPDYAWWYAMGHKSRAGQVYEVEPIGAVERDTSPNDGHDAFTCERARVVRVVKIDFRTRQRFQTHYRSSKWR